MAESLHFETTNFRNFQFILSRRLLSYGTIKKKKIFIFYYTNIVENIYRVNNGNYF